MNHQGRIAMSLLTACLLPHAIAPTWLPMSLDVPTATAAWDSRRHRLLLAYQAAVFDPTANAAGLIVSNGGHCRIGN